MSSKLLRDEIQLSTDLLSTGAFHCAICKQLLQPPVWLASDKRNLCNGCYRKRNPKHFKAIENPALGLILETLRFPCPHRSKGCEALLHNTQYQQHLSSCPHRHGCLLAGCLWEGTQRSLMMHLLDDHKDIELKDTNNDGVFPFNGHQGQRDVVNVIHTWLGRFVTRRKRLGDMVHVIIYSHDPYRGTEGQFFLQTPIDEALSQQHKCKITPDLNDLRRLDLTHATITENVPDMQLVIKRASHVTMACPALQLLYRCHDCGLFIEAKVRECPRGHHVCARCAGVGHKCYDNKEPTPEAAMTVLQFVPKGSELRCLFPCGYEGHGCRVKVPLQSPHSSVCSFQTVPCPKCRKHLLGYSHLGAHVRKVHADMALCSKTRTASAETDVLNSRAYFFLVCYGEVFLEKFSIDKNIEPSPDDEWYTWDVTGRSKEFVFTVELCTDNGSKRLSVTETCGVEVKLSQKMLDDFIKADEIKYCLRIDKKVSSFMSD